MTTLSRPIIATPYNLVTKHVTGPSAPTPWNSVQEVFDALGCEGLVSIGRRLAIYAQGEHAVAYSDIDYGTNTDYSKSN